MKRVVAFGNPLLDTTVYVTDDSLLKKYNLKDDGQKEICQDEMARISKDISGFDQHRSAGGCSQNSLRVLQWLTKKCTDAIYFGAVGQDEEAAILRSLLEADGVKTRYIQTNHPTGKTIGLIRGNDRSFVASLGAAKHLSIQDLVNLGDFKTTIESANAVYIEGFFLVDRIETATFILDLCRRLGKTVLFNICGEYVCERYPDVIKHFVENANIVFGSKKEFLALSKMLRHNTITDLNTYFFKNRELEKYVIITDGSNQGSLLRDHGNCTKFDVPSISQEEIKDTVGAGDAFAGGFIAGYINNKPIDQCIKIACYAALQIIQQTGCTIPAFRPNVFD